MSIGVPLIPMTGVPFQVPQYILGHEDPLQKLFCPTSSLSVLHSVTFCFITSSHTSASSRHEDWAEVMVAVLGTGQLAFAKHRFGQALSELSTYVTSCHAYHSP